MSSQVPPAPSRRLQRVAELLKREVSELLRRELSVEQVGLLSVNEVKVSPDLKSATVFIGFVGNRQQRSAAPELLAQRAKRIQMMLGSQLSMKWTPVLNFLLDESVEKGNRVLAILESLEKGTQPGS